MGHPQRGTPESGPVRERYEDTARSLLGDDGCEEALLRSALSDPETVLHHLLDGSGRGFRVASGPAVGTAVTTTTGHGIRHDGRCGPAPVRTRGRGPLRVGK
ncbi:hypothetical protein ACWGKW_43470 [Streptomyces sp. NPDC054766]|uniref:hypothetical protein n=1 Tax=Streptomyces rhizosphaerihabitans TaxID=1266770 RepID=UPI0021C22487|nr:hypothetical protein [Streptomyces rhizosphaerihabitans]MCT9007054.1 hypothetical protein [Streptomyces rhizosphaerihabitans]